MFAGINIWDLAQVLLIILVPELCLRVFIFAIVIWSRKSPNKSLANIKEFTVICLMISEKVAFTDSFYRWIRFERIHGPPFIGLHMGKKRSATWPL